MSRPKSAAVNNIDIANIFGSEMSVNIDIGKGNIDPALMSTDIRGQILLLGFPMPNVNGGLHSVVFTPTLPLLLALSSKVLLADVCLP